MLILFWTHADYHNVSTGHFALELCIDGQTYIMNFVGQTYHIYQWSYQNHEALKSTKIHQNLLQKIPLSKIWESDTIIDILNKNDLSGFWTSYQSLVDQRADILSTLSSDMIQQIPDSNIVFAQI